MNYLQFSMYKWCFMNRDSCISFFPIWKTLISFSCSISWIVTPEQCWLEVARTNILVFNLIVGRCHPISPLAMMLALFVCLVWFLGICPLSGYGSSLLSLVCWLFFIMKRCVFFPMLFCIHSDNHIIFLYPIGWGLTLIYFQIVNKLT